MSLHFGSVIFCSLQQCALSVCIYYLKGLIKSALVMQKTKESVIKMEISLMVPVKMDEAHRLAFSEKTVFGFFFGLPLIMIESRSKMLKIRWI